MQATFSPPWYDNLKDIEFNENETKNKDLMFSYKGNKYFKCNYAIVCTFQSFKIISIIYLSKTKLTSKETL